MLLLSVPLNNNYYHFLLFRFISIICVLRGNVIFCVTFIYTSSFAHSARPGHKVEMLGWSREKRHHQYFISGCRNSMVWKKDVVLTFVMGPIVLMQSCLIYGDQERCWHASGSPNLINLTLGRRPGELFVSYWRAAMFCLPLLSSGNRTCFRPF